MGNIKDDKALVAYCGLYCGACGRFTSGKCPGCRDNVKASWCTIRKCCVETSYASCADCTKMPIADCKKFNNVMSKVFGFIFRSNRPACIARIKDIGAEAFAREMAELGRQSIKR